MWLNAGKGKLDIWFANVYLIEDCLSVVAIIGLADDHFNLFVLVLGVAKLDCLVATQRVDLVVDYGELTIGYILELFVLLHTEVFASLLHLSQNLLSLRGQHPLIELLLLFHLSLFSSLFRNQFLIKLLPILFLFQLHHNFLFLLFESLIPIIDLDALISILVDIDDIYLAFPDLFGEGGLYGRRSTL